MNVPEGNMKQYSREEKAKWLEGWNGSGKSMLAYARENGLSPQTFSKWVKKSRGQPEFVEINEPARAPQGEILIEKGELKIHLPLNAGPPELRAVLEGLGVCHDR
jgi:transposase-like protein